MVQETARTLDPADADSVYEALPINQLFDGLVAADPELHVMPALASTWTKSQDGRTYTFRLRPDVRFHDGEPVTADDVVFTIRRLLSPEKEWNGVARSYLSVVEGAEAYTAGERDDLPGVVELDAQTVRIQLSRPYPSFLEVLTMDGLSVVPRHVVEQRGDEAFAREPVGSGPFRFVSWDDKSLRLEASEAYFAGRPLLDGVEINFLTDEEDDGGAERYFRDEVDVLEFGTDDLDRLSNDARTLIYRYQEMNLAFLGLCSRHGSLADARVRRAIAHAIDREALVSASPATRREAVGILPPGLPGYSPQKKALSFDPQEASRLLAAAGYPGGEGLEPVVLYTTTKSGAVQRLLEALGSDLQRVGIPLEVRDVNWAEFAQRLDEREAPAFLLGWIADLADPDAFLRSLFEPGAAANFFDLRDDRTHELIRNGAGEINPVRRAELYRELERHVLELAPLVPLYHTRGLLAMRHEVHGLEPGPLGLASVRLERVWLARSEGAT
jgi:peptide/nickel transport system substrate-binding protein/oligopeptide transport system substrate-binding protein